MKFTHLSRKDYITSEWAGGTTTQIAIMPKDAKYADRDFLWRVSSATVDLEESDFTPLPDYHRWIATIKGTMVLSHNSGTKISLDPCTVHPFNGGDATHSWGRCTDFNLMLHKEKTSGELQVLRIVKGDSSVIEITPKKDQVDLLCYCAEGSVEILSQSKSNSVHAKTSFLVEAKQGFQIEMYAAEQSILFIAVVHY